MPSYSGPDGNPHRCPAAHAALGVAVRLCLHHCRTTRAATTAQYYQERLATFERWLDAAGPLAPPDRDGWVRAAGTADG